MRYTRKVLERLPLPGVITRVETPYPVVALTFDDGPDPESTLASSHPVMPRTPTRERLFELRECQKTIEPHVERVGSARSGLSFVGPPPEPACDTPGSRCG